MPGKKSIKRYFVYFILLNIIVAGCYSSAEESSDVEHANIISVKDFRGKTLGFNKPAERVVCLIESALSGIYMLGAGEKVVGVPGDIYRNHLFFYYAQLDERIGNKELVSPGNWDFVSIEQVVGLESDLVIIWSSQTEAISALERFGIPVYAVMISSFEDVFKEIRDLGQILDRNGKADSLISYTRKKLQELEFKASESRIKSAYFMWAQGINETSGINSTVNELFWLAGLQNVCRLEQEHVTVSVEKIIDWNPEMIVMWNNEKLDPLDVTNNPLLQQINAVKNKMVFELPDPFLCDLWTLKFLFSVDLISQWSHQHPNQNSTDFEQIFKFFYGKSLETNEPEL
ncbi:MAG: ABC transporter substrate-binding protein [Bacteroidales bacterium]|nr:ABC transporter substrate-binding protein [Bacteroidales bacterium]